jgi:hypothetical protein
MNLKGLHSVDIAEIQEAITNEFKKVQKEEFSAAFQKLYDCAKPVYMALELILNLKKRYVSSIFEIISPKTFGLHCACFPKITQELFLSSSS